MIEVILVLALTALGLAYVAAPVLRGPRWEIGGPDGLEDASAAKDSALSALVDINEERDLGKLSEADFEELRTLYEVEAVEAIRRLDEIAGPDDRLEAEIAAMRARLTCSECGAVRTPGAPCSECGS